ncbi:hypothetical protein ACIPC2_07880 [Curtobacterium pusillum]|uniref:hypothetical protein n=1 Tax=Curtobacterium pusillum TaxID=69373 RepID=UPI003805654A
MTRPLTALGEPSGVHPFVTAATVLVQASIVQPRFRRPGLAILHTIADEPLSLRDFFGTTTPKTSPLVCHAFLGCWR